MARLPHLPLTPSSVLIRYAEWPADCATVERLAALDEAPVPADPVLIAEVDGEAAAAVGIESGERVADPFRRTADVVDLLARRAKRLRAAA